MSTPPPSFTYGILYSGFELPDIAGPLEILNMLAQYRGNGNMTLSIIARTMEPIAPSLPSSPGARFQGKQRWLPTHTFDSAPKLDVLLVPGGVGSVPPADFEAEAGFLRSLYRGQGGREVV